MLDQTEPPDISSLTDGFEGPEKRLEVIFAQRSDPKGLRSIKKEEWQEMLDFACCTIVSQTSNQFLDSFVLSESSLFVYPYKIILKTCGTTTLLRCLDKLRQLAKKVGTDIDFVVFSRKNFNFPQKQKFPHCNFENEVNLLNQQFNGSAHILGPVLSGGDHHYVYFSERSPEDFETETESRPMFDTKNSSATLEILMSELNPAIMNEYFFRNANFVNAKTTTKACGLADILPDYQMITDEIMFDPCGYSVNGISNVDGSYFTVHVTPEAHCSFVSFETNADLSPERRKQLIEEIVALFRPGRFSVVITSTDSVKFPKTKPLSGYSCRFKTQYEYDEGFHVFVSNFTAGLPRKNSNNSLVL